MSYDERNLANALLEFIQVQKEKEELTEDQKKIRAKKAAYALNLCTVSVSQMIDYDDINVLEQEYESILNNLNLQQMPKDQALLNILNHLLDTITYFRIQEGDKVFIDRRYQHHIKNAIWEAIPSLSILMNWSNPLNIATTVGLSYMNYRRRKADYILERDFQYWQLERAAIDQLNNLQRELFDTSWRLADTYNFDDKFRLTEKQIKQYNAILTDPDPRRRYERLEVIEDNFHAYPPYWYFLGHAALEVISDDKRGEKALNDDQKSELTKKAQNAFDQLLKDELYNILREDTIVSACALEYIDTLDAEKNKEEIEKLIHRAYDMSGNSYDVWELCSLAYLRINQIEEACKLLCRLVNENYNAEINAQLLSSLYMKQYVHSNNPKVLENYELLASRAVDYYLFPVPEKLTPEAYDESQNEFVGYKKCSIKERYGLVLLNYISESRLRFENLYKHYFSDSNPDPEDVIAFFNSVLMDVCQLPGITPSAQDDVLSSVSMGLESMRDKFYLNQKTKRNTQIDKNLFSEIMNPALSLIGNCISIYIDMADNLSELSQAENGLSKFCQSVKIKEPEFIKRKENESIASRLLDITVFGELSEEEKVKTEQYKKVQEILIDYSGRIFKEDGCKNTRLLENSGENTQYYEQYFNNWIFSLNANRQIKRETVAILVNEKTHNDIIITAYGIKRRIGFANYITKNIRFGEIDWGKKGKNEILLGNVESSINIPYRNDEVKMEILLEMFQKLAGITENAYQEIDYSNPLQMLISI